MPGPTDEKESSVEAVKAACLRLLSRREHSRGELRRKMLERGFCGLPVEVALEALAREGWQSDERFVESFLRQRIGQGYGPFRLQQELRQRGVDLPWNDELAGMNEEDWRVSIERVYRKKFRDSVPGSLAEVGKRSRFLSQRGFTGEQIRALFERLKRS